jgi:thioredoxin 1
MNAGKSLSLGAASVSGIVAALLLAAVGCDVNSLGGSGRTVETYDPAGAKVVLYEFWAPWCGPCRAMKPVLEDFERQHPNYPFARINIDEEPDRAQEYGVTTIPTILVTQYGAVVYEIVGSLSLESLNQQLEPYLSE